MSVGNPSAASEFGQIPIVHSQFNRLLLGLSGACEVCGETPRGKISAQSLGQRMLVANVTSCNRIWVGTAGRVRRVVR